MFLTSVLLVINDQFNAVDVIEENIKCAGSRLQLLVYNNGCRTSEIVSEVQSLATLYIENNSPFEKTFGECVNELLRITSGDFIFVLDHYAYFDNNWLKNLCDFYTSNNKSGVISFGKSQNQSVEYLLDSNEKLVPVYSDYNVVDQLPFFKKEHLFIIGGFNPKYNAKYAIIDFSFRLFHKHGYVNYYIPELNYVSSQIYIDAQFVGSTKIKNEISSLKNDFIELFVLTPRIQSVIEQLKNHFQENVIFSQKLGAIFINEKHLDATHISFLNEITTNNNLTIDLFPQSFFSEYILRQSVIILIREN